MYIYVQKLYINNVEYKQYQSHIYVINIIIEYVGLNVKYDIKLILILMILLY